MNSLVLAASTSVAGQRRSAVDTSEQHCRSSTPTHNVTLHKNRNWINTQQRQLLRAATFQPSTSSYSMHTVLDVKYILMGEHILSQ